MHIGLLHFFICGAVMSMVHGTLETAHVEYVAMGISTGPSALYDRKDGHRSVTVANLIFWASRQLSVLNYIIIL